VDSAATLHLNTE